MLPEFTEDILDVVEGGAISWETAKMKAGAKPDKCEGCQDRDSSGYLDGQWLCVQCMNDAVQERYNRPEDQEKIAKFIAERKWG